MYVTPLVGGAAPGWGASPSVATVYCSSDSDNIIVVSDDFRQVPKRVEQHQVQLQHLQQDRALQPTVRGWFPSCEECFALSA